MFDPRINLSNEVSMQLIKHFDRKVFRTIIPRNVRLADLRSRVVLVDQDPFIFHATVAENGRPEGRPPRAYAMEYRPLERKKKVR